MVNVYKMFGVSFILVFPLLFLGANGQIQYGDSTTITSEDDMTTTPITIIGCFFNGASYHPGSDIQNACAKLVCDGNTGQFIDQGIKKKCPKCKAYLDPHIVTYDSKDSYDYMGCGNHSLSQIGYSYQPTLAIYATFKYCEVGSWYGVSCVDSVTFKNDEHTVITINGSNPGQIEVNGENYNVPSSSPSIVRVNNTEYPVLAWWGRDTQVFLQGSSGFLVIFIWSSRANSVRVFANSDVAEGLTGLCGNSNNNMNDDFTNRDESIVSWEKLAPDDFTTSWLVSNTGNANCYGIVKRQAQNNCETDSSVQDDFYRKCNTTVWNGYPDADPEEAQIIIDDCLYDLCHVSDPDAWLEAVEEETQVEADIQEKTLNCFWLGEFYPQNSTRPGECGEETCEAGSWVLIDNSTSTCISDFTTTTTATTMATTTLAPTTFEKTTTTSTVPTTVEPSTTTPITNIGTTANNEVPPQIVLPAPPIEKNMNLKIQILQIVN